MDEKSNKRAIKICPRAVHISCSRYPFNSNCGSTDGHTIGGVIVCSVG